MANYTQPQQLIKFFALTVLFVFLSSSCSKFLDKKSDDSYRELVELSDFQALLDLHSAMNEQSITNLGESVSDQYFLSESDFNSLSDVYRNNYIWDYPDELWPNDWASYYRIVGRSNLALEGVESISRTNVNAKSWDQIKGSALFFRAFAFLNLTWTYAKAYDEQSYETDMGVPLRTNSNFNNFFDRSNVKDTYARIIEDLNEAIGLLPDHPIHVYRPSNRAVHALLARVYLSMRNYDKALVHANASLTIYNTLLDFKTELPNINAAIPFPQFNKEVMFYFETNVFFGKMASGACVDTLLYQKFDVDDLRKTAFFTPYGKYHRFKPHYSSKDYTIFTGLATDEMYLIRAESLARLNEEQTAAKALSDLLSHRYVGTNPVVVNERGEALLGRILLERQKELLNRGVRWSDIKRLNKEGRNISLTRKLGAKNYVLEPNENRFALPLPADIIEISGMKQNPK